MKNFLLAALYFLSAFSPTIFALDGVNIGIGGGDESSTIAEASAKWDWESQWFTEGDWYVGGYWEAGVGHWYGESGEHRNSDITHVGITPVFRLTRHDKLANGMKPFLEGAIGIHLMSDEKIGDKDLGGNFIFGDHISAGAQFGEGLQHELSLRLQHFSNADIYGSNPGFDFGTIRYGYNFD